MVVEQASVLRAFVAPCEPAGLAGDHTLLMQEIHECGVVADFDTALTPLAESELEIKASWSQI